MRSSKVVHLINRLNLNPKPTGLSPFSQGSFPWMHLTSHSKSQNCSKNRRSFEKK